MELCLRLSGMISGGRLVEEILGNVGVGVSDMVENDKGVCKKMEAK